ncbi:hypothetical protein E4H12_14335 [Candidatus Thorarchaeota archaeon]|nr:MAG: hypothetical protein E4H12_14335 [Candidatus Thorarchaeota archaeon]
MAQQTIEGTDVKRETVTVKKDVYAGRFYTLTLSDSAKEQLDKLAEKSVDNRHWIACHMKIKEKLTVNHEGKCFQDDLEQFKLALK